MNADVASDGWELADPAVTYIPANTKHGSVLPLARPEWQQLRNHRF